MTNQKNSYEQIHIPDSLSSIRRNACHRVKKEQKLYRIRLGVSCTAAACLLLLTLSNTHVTFAALKDVPLLGSIVRVLHFGEGGKITDGAKIENVQENNQLKIYFTYNAEFLQDAPAYTIEKKDAPNRIILTLNGVREFSSEELIKNAKKIKYIKDAYSSIILDDSCVQIIIELNKNVDYELIEFKEPGYLELLFNESSVQEDDNTIYFIRSDSMEMNEQLGALTEIYNKYDSNIVKTQGNKYTMVIGKFSTKKEAMNELKKINKKISIDNGLYVDSTLSNENPK